MPVQGRGDRIAECRGVPESCDVAQAGDVTQTGDVAQAYEGTGELTHPPGRARSSDDHEVVPCRHDRRRAAATPLAVQPSRGRVRPRQADHRAPPGRRPAPVHPDRRRARGQSEAAVRARTNRLIERGILQVVGVTDPLKLGFQQMAMIGIRCESDQLVAVAEEVAEMPEVDYVVITAGHLRPAHRDRLRGQRGAAALPDRAAARDRRRPRDRDLRLPADGQADVPVGDALAPLAKRRASARGVASAHRRVRRLRSHPAVRARPGLRWPCVAGAHPRPDRGRGGRESRGHGRAPRGSPAIGRIAERASRRRSRGDVGPSGHGRGRRGRRRGDDEPPGRGRLDPDLRPRRPHRAGSSCWRPRRSSAVTGLWPQSQPAIFLLLALAGVFVLVIHDLLPANALGPAKFVAGGFGRDHGRDDARRPDRRRGESVLLLYPLIVGGAALVVSPADHARPRRASPRSATCWPWSSVRPGRSSRTR